MGLERLSNESKIIFINIRILLLLSTEEVKHIVLDFRRFLVSGRLLSRTAAGNRA